MLKASIGIYLMRTGCPKLDISNKNATRAISSSTVRYCWRWAISSFEGRPRCRLYSVVRAIPLASARAAHVRSSSGGASASALLAASSLRSRWYCATPATSQPCLRARAKNSHFSMEASRRAPHFGKLFLPAAQNAPIAVVNQ
jgi:hypothetical protein